MNVLFGNEKWHQAAALYVRMQVFVLERGIRLTEEFDLDDHDKTDYVVIYDENKPVATGRYKQMDAENDSSWKDCGAKRLSKSWTWTTNH